MDFGLLPPEINSGRMYSGPGAASMLAAAAAWDRLASELGSTAASYRSVIARLGSASWVGPASASMAAAAAPYAAWMSATATQAEQAANQAGAAAAAHEAAFAAMVPPPVIAANRAQLMSLIATNFLGQNAMAIAATEAHYGEMWAQDAAAMFGYASRSAAATMLTQFNPPPPTTSPVGLAGQAIGAQPEAIMSTGRQLLSTVPQSMNQLSSPTPGPSSLNSAVYPATMAARVAMSPLSSLINRAMSTGAGRGAGAAAKGLAAGLRVLGGTPAVSASMGQATAMGRLSVPQGWTAPIGALRSVAAALPGATVNGARPSGAAAMPLMPIANMAGRASGSAASHYEFRPSVVPRSPAGG